jgi:hypothetical protein
MKPKRDIGEINMISNIDMIIKMDGHAYKPKETHHHSSYSATISPYEIFWIKLRSTFYAEYQNIEHSEII